MNQLYPFFICLCVIAESHSFDMRVSGGRGTRRNDLLFIIRIVYMNNKGGYAISCTGSVITPLFSLSAAHCKPKDKLKRYILYFLKDSQPARLANIVKFFNHPNYKLNGDNDISVIQHQRIHLPEYGKISSVDVKALFGQHCYITGYGPRKEKGKPVRYLQILDGVIVKCDLQKKYTMYPKICIMRKCSNMTYGGICGGDSGGPLIHASGIVGVNSKGFNCRKSTPLAGIIAPISSYIQWIRQIVKVKRIGRNNQLRTFNQTKKLSVEIRLGRLNNNYVTK